MHPSPENDELYRPVLRSDPSVQALAESIRQHGVREPIVITLDGYIVSGHRRFVAAQLAGLVTVPVRVEQIQRSDDIDAFVVLLREYNRQREKSFSEKLREELVSTSTDTAYESLIEQRSAACAVAAPAMEIRGVKRRCKISRAKHDFVAAILRVLEDRRKFWPLSDRAIHYALLNSPPLIHASKAQSRYANTTACYKALTELLTRGRLFGVFPMQAIADETRPITIWNVFPETGAFLKQELDQFLSGYWRNLMQSQPNHVELICEKNTVEPIIRSVAMEYCIPLTSGRGYCSLPPRTAMANRFQDSGKEKFVLLMLSDFDPDGEEIAHSFARSLRDDFNIERIHPIKVALTGRQVEQYQLPPVMTAKSTSVHYERFTAEHGHNVFELEALPPGMLQDIVRQAIDSVIDRDLFNRELAAEKQDAHHLSGIRSTVHQTLRDVIDDLELDLETGGDAE